MLRNSARHQNSRRRHYRLTSGLACDVTQLEERLLLTVGPDGWTNLAPSEDSRVIYVSSSSGNDSNSGLSENAPVATISHAISLMRTGYPDWMVLKHGDEFVANIPFSKSGRSESEPTVISGYGEGARPIINGDGFRYWGLNGGPGFSMDYVAITGLDFQGHGTEGKGINFSGGMSHILFENNSFTEYGTGSLHVQGINGENPSNISFRRNVVTGAAGQGILVGNVTGLLIEGNMFDWNGHSGEGANKLRHNAYLGDIHDLVVRDNIFARGSNFGLKMATEEIAGFTDFVVEDNLFFNNGISMDASSSAERGITTYRHQRGVVKDNVFTKLERTFYNGSTQDLAAWLRNSEDINWDSNYFVHKDSFANNPMFVWGHNERHKDITIQNTVVYDWRVGDEEPDPTLYFEYNAYREPPEGGVTNLQLIDNEVDLPAASYVDPTRTLGSYYASIGGVNDPVAFLLAARDMSKANWNSAYTADAVNDYIMEGFARVLATPVFSSPPDSQSADPFSTVSWNTVDGADDYELWYTNLSTGENPAVNEVTPATTFSPSSALDIGRYRIWVRAVQDVGPASPWSDPITVHINTPPVVDPLPSDGQNARPQITWNAVPGADHYEVWGNNVTTGDSQVVHGTNITATSHTPNTDVGFGEYRFWVRAFDQAGVASDWSTPEDYSRESATTVVDPLPFDGIDSRPTFTWAAVGGADSYELWADNVTLGLTKIVDETGVATNSFQPAAPLPFGQYRMWVRPVDADGLFGRWSAAAIGNNTPAAVTPIEPTFSRQPEFTWGAVPGAISYEIYLSFEQGSPVNDLGMTQASWTPPTELPIGTIDWWVRPHGTSEIVGAWSKMARTHIGGRTDILSAGVSEGSSGQRGLFEWQSVTGAGRYILHVVRVNHGVVIQEDYLTGTSFQTEAQLAAGTYRAWVKAIDSSDDTTGIWSHMVQFTVAERSADGTAQDFTVGPQIALSQSESALEESAGQLLNVVRNAEKKVHSNGKVSRRPISVAVASGQSAVLNEVDAAVSAQSESAPTRMTEHEASLIDLLMSSPQEALMGSLT